ncbi:MAG: S8 family serine peptidase [Phycisphaerales bacterium]|nr:S8 family serine peptidase [Phycisphaerales bacterium]
MFTRTRRLSMMAFATLAASAMLQGFDSTSALGASDKDDSYELPLGSEPGMLYIRFKDSIAPAQGMSLMSYSGSPDHVPELEGAEWTRATGDLKQSDIAYMHARAEEKLGRDLPNPWQGVYVNLKKGIDAADAIVAVRETGFAIKALHVPMVSTMPLTNVPDYQPQQGYLRSAMEHGIGAEIVWDRFNMTGEGVSFCDIEYNFDPMHCDLPEIQDLGPHCPHPRGTHHGTAAIGCVAALDNGSGTTGIAHGVSGVYFAPGAEVYEHEGEQKIRSIVDRAIFQAMMALDPGDVLLFEVAMYGPNWNGNINSQRGSVPLEWYEPWYDAIVMAVANGLILVEPAGNGYENLDDPIYSQDNGGHWPFLPENDSGAIMVGAGKTHGQRARAHDPFSNYGDTVDVQAWGRNVTTAGYGSSSNNCGFTNGFNGTSSASSIIAGATVLLQSYMKNRWGRTLSPAEMKQVLRATGQPQRVAADGTLNNIGPLPDLVAATDYYESQSPLHRVPQHHATIQEAVDAAGNGDTILVGPGVWSGFEVDRKTLVIQSTDGHEFTSIDGAGGSCITTLNSSVEIQGFTIHDCEASDGAGVYADGEWLTVRECVFRDNLATVSGGGIWSGCDNTRITRCEFQSNRAWFVGAGVYLAGAAAEVTDNTFQGNSADYGGGVSTKAERAWIVNNVFHDNDARFAGGGLDLWEGVVDVMECTFDRNNSNRGGGLSMGHAASGSITDSMFTMNTADLQGAGCWLGDASPWITGCRFAENIAVNSGGAIESAGTSMPEIKESVLCGNLPEPVMGNYQDSGDNCFALDCEDANNNGTPDECDSSNGDVDGNGVVNVEDLLAAIAAFGHCDGCPEDINGDGVVDVEDLLAILACWQGGC